MLSLILAVGLIISQEPSVGVAPFIAISSQPADTVNALLWYPTLSEARDTALGLQLARIAYRAPIAPSSGQYPIILISHGTGGNEVGHIDLAMALVRAGFLVLSVRHPGDNSSDRSGLGTDIQFYGRSHHVGLALDRLIGDSLWGPHIDPNRVGFYGFSAGAYTGLTLLGAKPDFNRLTAYCHRHPSHAPYCVDGLNGKVSLTGRYAEPRVEPRIRAAALVAPAFAFLFNGVMLEKIQTPIFVARADSDMVVIEPDNVTWLAGHVRLAEPVFLVPGAGHYIFLAPCSTALAARVPSICVDPPGVDRVAVHTALNARLVRFFQRRLGDGLQ
ncbi:MAG: hypothetical protein ABI679_16360 [Gemmatimonadota bacterium]